MRVSRQTGWGPTRARGGVFSLLIALLGVVGVLGIASPAAGQAEATAGGRVISIGFNNGSYHPTEWVPMRVAVTPPGAESGTYRLRVYQKDLDNDIVVFERFVNLTGGLPNQQFWVYFKPETRGGGLPTLVLDELRSRLRVVLATEDGRELAQLSIAQPVQPLYSGRKKGSYGNGRSTRLVLIVNSPNSGFVPGGDEYAPDVVGLAEQYLLVPVTPDQLPDRMIGYDSVDAVIWQGADPTDLSRGGATGLAALQQWVKAGGRMLVTHPGEFERLEGMFDMLPVTPQGSFEMDSIMPIHALAGVTTSAPADEWQQQTGPFRYVAASPKPEALVEAWLNPEDLPRNISDQAPAGRLPLVVRGAYGFGSVAWIGTDLSNPNLRGPATARTKGWVIILSRLLGYNDEPRPNIEENSNVRASFLASSYRDLGSAPEDGMALSGKSMLLVTLAMIVFIAYWLIAGPGMYFYLAAKKKTHLSWFGYGAAAITAALLTFGLSKLVLRGPPELKHVSVLRMGQMADTFVQSDFGLYIPEDGMQELSLGEGVTTPPAIAAYSPKPEDISDSSRTNPIRYTVSMDPPTQDELEREGETIKLDIPYRSTLKKFESRWIGPSNGGISGQAKMGVEGNTLARFPSGSLINSTGRNLRNVHIAYRRSPTTSAVTILYLPSWSSGQTLASLESEFQPAEGSVKTVGISGGSNIARARNEKVYGDLDLNWAEYWFTDFRRAQYLDGPEGVIDWSRSDRTSPTVLSFFSLLPPMRNADPATPNAVKLLRRGQRGWDVGAAVMAGNLVIVGEAIGDPLPMPLEVDGRPVTGDGTTLVQVVLPLDRSAVQQVEQQGAEQYYEDWLEEQEADTEASTAPATNADRSNEADEAIDESTNEVVDESADG